MLEALRDYLLSQGYENITIDYLPALPHSAVGLYQWSDSPQVDGTSLRYVQVRCRDRSASTARARCCAIARLLDSGMGETPLPIPYGLVIGTLRRGAVLLDRDEKTATYYCEVALWGRKEQ